jgi:MscS family membrane protein
MSSASWVAELPALLVRRPPAQVGDEVLFRPSSGQVVEGIVVDVGWYRTTIRSFEREIYMIPNSGEKR